jgi:hypothetical protein
MKSLETAHISVFKGIIELERDIGNSVNGALDDFMRFVVILLCVYGTETRLS